MSSDNIAEQTKQDDTLEAKQESFLEEKASFESTHDNPQIKKKEKDTDRRQAKIHSPPIVSFSACDQRLPPTRR